MNANEAYSRIAHTIQEQIMVSLFGEQNRRILLFILRLSWDCDKQMAYIPRQRDFEVIGISEGHIKAHLDWLIAACVIMRRGRYYSFNKNFDQWRVERAAKYMPRKFGYLVSLNLRTPDPQPVGHLQLTPKVSSDLPKTEVQTYGKGKFLTPDPASAKERLNKDINKNIKYQGEDAADIWTKVLAMLRPQVNAANYSTWLKDTRGVLCEDHIFMLKVPNASVAQYLDTRLRSLIEKTIIDITLVECKIAFKAGSGGEGDRD